MSRCRPRTFARILLLAAALPSAAVAGEPVHVEPLWLEPVSRHPTSQATTPFKVPALLRLPPGWMAGDAAALVIGDQPGPEEARDHLVAALLDQNTAVLEIDVHTGRGLSPDSPAAPTPTVPEDLLPDLFAALLALRRDAGAGMVVAVGYGAGGKAALLATDGAAAAECLGARGPRFVAAAMLGPGQPAFAPGTTPLAKEAWPARVPMLCSMLSAAVVIEARGRVGGVPGPASLQAAASRDCLAALLPPPVHPVAGAVPRRSGTVASAGR